MLTILMSLTDHKLVVHLNCISKKEVEGLCCEINTVTCDYLSHHSFLQNNDLNVTGVCLDINFSQDQLFTLRASPCFWKFAFDKNANRKIQVAKPYNTTEYEATTLVRMAFKAFELKFSFTFGSLNPIVGTIAALQKEKFDEMKA